MNHKPTARKEYDARKSYWDERRRKKEQQNEIKRQKKLERQELEEKERQETARLNREKKRSAMLRSIYKLLKRILRLGHLTLSIETKHDELDARMIKHFQQEQDPDPGNIFKNVDRVFLGAAYTSCVFVIDYLFLNGLSGFLISLGSGIPDWVVIMGKVAVPLSLIVWEIAIARRPDRKTWVGYLLPCTIGFAAALTFAAGTPDDMLVEPEGLGLLVIVFTIGFLLHFFVIELAPSVSEGFGFLWLATKRQVLKGRAAAFGKALAATYAAVVDYLHAIDVFNAEYDETLVPEFRWIPVDVAKLVNDHAGEGRELIPLELSGDPSPAPSSVYKLPLSPHNGDGAAVDAEPAD